MQQQSTWTHQGKALDFHFPDGVLVKWDCFLHSTNRKRRITNSRSWHALNAHHFVALQRVTGQHLTAAP